MPVFIGEIKYLEDGTIDIEALGLPRNYNLGMCQRCDFYTGNDNSPCKRSRCTDKYEYAYVDDDTKPKEPLYTQDEIDEEEYPDEW